MGSQSLINEANSKAVDKIMNSHPVLIDVGMALDVIPGMKRDLFLHAGPPIDWHSMCGPMRGAALGAVVYEGLANGLKEAEKVLDSGGIEFSPTHHHNAVAPMAGIISPSMPVYVVENRTYGNKAFANINEGVGQVKTLRFGANDRTVLDRLKWMRNVLAPALRESVRRYGGIDLREIIAEALRRGDECHNRNKSATAALYMILAPRLIKLDIPRDDVATILEFIAGNPHFFLNLSMAASKSTMDAAHGIPYSTIITVMSTNGVEFGIRVSGLGDEWFTAPAPRQDKGKIFPGFSPDDANPVFGDSYISEPAGIGAFAMAASPAIAEFTGGTPKYGLEITENMYKITVAEHKYYKIPYLNYRGTPTGIDLRKVLETGIAPIVNTGLAHKKPGIGQIGAGIASAPIECFEKAALAFQNKYGVRLAGEDK